MSASTLTYRSFLPINSLKRGGCVYCRQRLRENNAVGGALLSVGISIALLAPLPALPLPSNPTTPFSESQSLQLGLENGKHHILDNCFQVFNRRIRSCPSSNPNCISTTSRSASFAMPWGIPEDYPDNAVQKIEDAILKTQRNPKIQKKEATPSGIKMATPKLERSTSQIKDGLIKDDQARTRATSSSLASTRTAFFGLTSSRATSPIQYSKARYINHPANQGHKKSEQRVR
ncbi:thylakoid lumenal 17.9 kDa protein, chloroplastic isoform X1 [Cryptomeria japonica]|uniref:thylakoid lumenal 17.9 kDa protein, chloroplastic isoform X1 n=1 Tax=Cryptomeria japonica TaxID=3369 RepID=UPI0027DA5D00|nr:thylakoid lumenal 17.9 kDa protein, chloroplastic isoform X1 [Cryptomeria japonica]